ncbi:hypothetical protein PV04_02661 [Phialophora macrospora]|uniref:Uncharacterized protein n=1 Tax=Phialophora macrospora TaxID=1851006 RepID=A0A0D2FQ14_9EURO|nr:hypothetical protein PV04_02661 [Phialophora macrospora]
MPRITPLRILLLVPLFYASLVLLWATLPSPDVSWGTDISDKTAEYLWRGGTVTRVYDVDDFFPYTDMTPAVQAGRRSQRSSFALDFAYNASARSLTMSGYYDAQVWNLTMLMEVASNEDGNIYLTEAFGVAVKTGDHDGINMPWFTPADATLLFWEIHKDVVTVSLRIRVFGDGNVQVLPDGNLWAHANYAQRQHSIVPLLSLVVDPTNAEGALQQAIWPAGEVTPNSSPSSTFRARRTILRVLLPSWSLVAKGVIPRIGKLIIVLAGALYLAFWMCVVYTAVVMACWKASRTAAFWPWARTFWMTRHVVSYLGAKVSSSARGPDEGRIVVATDGNKADATASGAGDEVVSSTGPRPLTSPWAFFTSSSPLDDLFVTFEATKPLVQPIGRNGLRRRRTGDDLERQVESAPSASSASEVVDEKKDTSEPCFAPPYPPPPSQ